MFKSTEEMWGSILMSFLCLGIGVAAECLRYKWGKDMEREHKQFLEEKAKALS